MENNFVGHYGISTLLDIANNIITHNNISALLTYTRIASLSYRLVLEISSATMVQLIPIIVVLTKHYRSWNGQLQHYLSVYTYTHGTTHYKYSQLLIGH